MGRREVDNGKGLASSQRLGILMRKNIGIATFFEWVVDRPKYSVSKRVSSHRSCWSFPDLNEAAATSCITTSQKAVKVSVCYTRCVSASGLEVIHQRSSQSTSFPNTKQTSLFSFCKRISQRCPLLPSLPDYSCLSSNYYEAAIVCRTLHEKLTCMNAMNAMSRVSACHENHPLAALFLCCSDLLSSFPSIFRTRAIFSMSKPHISSTADHVRPHHSAAHRCAGLLRSKPIQPMPRRSQQKA